MLLRDSNFLLNLPGGVGFNVVTLAGKVTTGQKRRSCNLPETKKCITGALSVQLGYYKN